MGIRHTAPPSGTNRARVRSERGETLLEIMATVLLMGLAIVAVLTMIMLAVNVTSSYRKTTRASNQALDFAEDLLRTDSGVLYQPCTASVTPGYAYTQQQQGYNVTVSNVQFLTSKATTTPSWQDGCPSAGDQGLQRLTLRVTAPKNDREQQEETVIVIKRNRTCSNGTGEQC